MKLRDQVAIVTGAGGGIGRAIAVKFAEEGAHIVIVYSRNDIKAKETAALVEERGRKALVKKADVSNVSSITDVINEVGATFNRIDCLVNNAGTFDSAPFLDLPEEAWDRVLDVDLKGTYVCSQAFARYLRDEGKPGKIINIGSIHGTRAWKGASNYATAKAGLIQLNRAMALELADYNITVNLVSPGAIAAGPNEGREKNPDFVRRVKEEIPLRRMGEAEEVANLVLFLASEESNYITGTEIIIDGGLLLHPFSV